MFRLLTLAHAYDLSLSQEKQLQSISAKLKLNRFPLSTINPNPTTLIISPSTNPTSLPKKFLTQAQIQARREKKCATTVMKPILWGTNEEENECPPLEVETNAENPQVNLDQVEAEVSFNALTTPNSFSTFRLRGVFGRTPINLLVDIGSTHTFLDEVGSKNLGCLYLVLNL
ncbi:hypothetical protein Leryth_020658 [Lithospermum erythrorhizon]|nr:hypothetical protein Leryth_020658 [Lithospermum erythrorhizon]